MGGFFYTLALGFALLLLFFGGAAEAGAADGLRLFINSVLPCLFPFMVCGHYLSGAGGRLIRGRLNAARRLGLTAVCAVCGTPSAALIAADLRRGGMSARRASVLCAVMNLVNPYFIVGLLSRELLHAPGAWRVLALAHYAPALLAAALLSLRPGAAFSALREGPAARPSLARALSDATFAVLRVGGTVVFFRVMYAVAVSSGLLCLLSPGSGAVAAGLFEMTNGLALLASAPVSGRLCFSLCGGIMSFGGVCLYMQSKLFFEELRPLPYFAAKLVTGAVSFLVCFLLCPDSFGSAGAAALLDERLMLDRAGETLCLAVCVALALAASFTFARIAVRRRTI